MPTAQELAARVRAREEGGVEYGMESSSSEEEDAEVEEDDYEDATEELEAEGETVHRSGVI